MSSAAAIRLHGEIETARPLRAQAGLVSMRGWCLIEGQPGAPPVRLTTDSGILLLSVRVPRPDIRQFFPAEPGAGTCGFVIEGRLPAGVHVARFEAQLPDGSWRSFKILSIYVEPAPFLASVETPAPGGVLTERVHVHGWALHPAQNLRRLTMRYGHQEIPCTPGSPRPDLRSQYPDGPDASQAGFRSDTILSAGCGNLRFKALLADGTFAVAPTPLRVAIATDENHGLDLDFNATRIELPRGKINQAALAGPATMATRSLRILFVLPGSFASNSALHVAALANELARAGHTCAVAVPRDLETLAHHAAPAFTGTTYAQAGEHPIFADRAAPDLIHAWTTRENVRQFVEKIRAESTHRPRLIVHLEDNELQLLALHLGLSLAELAALDADTLVRIVPPDLSHPHRSRQFLAAADGVTVITDRLREFVPPGLPAHTVWPAADARYFSARPTPRAFRNILDRRPGETVLFYHGNIHASNVAEVGELYGAIRDLNARGHPVTLIRTGLNSAALPDDLLRDTAPHVLDLGQILHHHHLPALMALADIFVQPGSPDAFNDYRFPSKIPEFFAISRPVVLPRTNLGERLRHGVDAYVLDRADAASIAAAITELRQDQPLYDRLSRGAVAFAAEHFSWSRSAAQLAGFYQATVEA